jgi:hypothetical protein
MDSEPRIETYYVCPCGWRREYTDTEKWKRRRIRHPLWGNVTNYSAAVLDVQIHDCIETNAALRRSPRSREVPVDYEAAQERKELEAARKSVGRTRAESAVT